MITADQLRDLAKDAEYTINYAFGEPTVAISQANVIALADTLDRFGSAGIPTVKVLYWYEIGDRGLVAVVTLDRDCQRSELMTLFARVRIDGNEYAVKGVESFAVEKQRKGWAIGLLVEKRIEGEA